MRIVLSGPPSVGKTTQGSLLAEWLSVPHISSGALIREGAAAGDRSAMVLEALVADGDLAPSDAIVALVMARLAAPDCGDGFILDGFPRKVVEAEALLLSKGVDVFVVLQASAETLMSRVAERSRQAAFVRVDDDPKVFPNRIAAYLAETSVVRGVMEDAGVPVLVIDAEQTAEHVAAAIKARVSSYLPADLSEGQRVFAF